MADVRRQPEPARLDARQRGRFDALFGADNGDGWFPSPAHVMRRAAIMDAFAHYPPGRLLEMGCGAGRMLADWHRLGHSGEAVDLDATARKMAVECVRAFDAGFEVLKYPRGDGFDYLVTTEVLEHIDDPAALLKDWVAHLRPGGIMLATVPAYASLWGKSDEWAGHVQRFEPADFRRIVEDAGLEVLEQRLYGYPIGNLLRIAGNFTSDLKMRKRGKAVSRAEATFASGRERSIENRLAPVMRSLPMRALLKLAISLQRSFDRGHGLLVIARKLDAGGKNAMRAAAPAVSR